MNQVTQQTEAGNADAPEGVVATPDASSPATASFLKRRKLVTHAAAAPILLAVSGRSALACSNIPTGMSFAAWVSVHPGGGGTACVSHSVGGTPHGDCRSHTDWTPKKTGNCFTVFWPSECKPFVKCQQRYWNSYGQKKYRLVDYQENTQYQEVCHYWNDTPTPCAGWNGKNSDGYNFSSGTKLAWLDSNRSVSKILIDDSKLTTGCKAHLAAAYLNACKFPGSSVLTKAQVQELATTGKIGNSGVVLTAQEIRAFLEQTWT